MHQTKKTIQKQHSTSCSNTIICLFTRYQWLIKEYVSTLSTSSTVTVNEILEGNDNLVSVSYSLVIHREFLVAQGICCVMGYPGEVPYHRSCQCLSTQFAFAADKNMELLDLLHALALLWLQNNTVCL